MPAFCNGADVGTVNLEPVYGILLAFVFFKEYEMLSPEFYMGMALILVSVLLQMLRVLRPGKPPQPLVKEKSGID